MTACSLLISFKSFRNCSRFDEDYFLYCEDFDLCLRDRKLGHQIGMTPRVGVTHHPSSIIGKNPRIKLRHSIYSYPLSWDKHAAGSVLFCRLLRIGFVGGFTLPFRPQMASAKLGGVFRYVRYFVLRYQDSNPPSFHDRK
ncbi:MAG: glycosyltransferase family 2 protein [Limnospira sp.]